MKLEGACIEVPSILNKKGAKYNALLMVNFEVSMSSRLLHSWNFVKLPSVLFFTFEVFSCVNFKYPRILNIIYVQGLSRRLTS